MRNLEYKWQAAVIVALGLFLSVLDSTIVSVALPAIRGDFHTDFNTTTWVVTAYFLAQAAVIPVTGYISTRSGTKVVFLVSMGIFVLGSALCVAAQTKEFLIGARIIQGIGGGGIFPTSFAIAYRAFPRDEWGRATTIIGVPVLLAPALGPFIGGYLTAEFQWRAIFIINIPLGVLSFLLALALLQNQAQDLGDPGDVPTAGHLDVPGLALAASGFAVLVFGLTQAGTRGWEDRLVVGSVLVGLLLLIVLALVELRSEDPVLDLRLFRNPTFVRAVVVLWIVSAFYYGGLFLIPFFFERVQALSPLKAGEIMIVQGVGAAIGIGLGGELYNKYGPRRLITVGTALLTVSSIGFARLSVGSTGLSLQLWLLLRGLGLGVTNTPVQNLALSVVSRHDLGRGSSLVNVTRQVSIAGGVAALASLTSQQAAKHARILAASSSSHAPDASTLACLRGPRGSLSTCLSQHAVVMGLDDAFFVALAGCALAIVLAVFVGRDPSREALKGSALAGIAAAFPQLSRPQLVEAATRAHPLTFEPGQVVIRQNDEPDWFYVVVRGDVLVRRRTEDGRDVEVAHLRAGQYVGEIGLLERIPRTATVIAVEPTEVLGIDRATFAELLSDSGVAASVHDEVHLRMASLT
jgi:EmrB/QacA subfamily drug resistance transporter